MEVLKPMSNVQYLTSTLVMGQRHIRKPTRSNRRSTVVFSESKKSVRFPRRSYGDTSQASPVDSLRQNPVSLRTFG